jgi:hypothetical protein
MRRIDARLRDHRRFADELEQIMARTARETNNKF